jgi:hypothetical protein
MFGALRGNLILVEVGSVVLLCVEIAIILGIVIKMSDWLLNIRV